MNTVKFFISRPKASLQPLHIAVNETFPVAIEHRDFFLSSSKRPQLLSFKIDNHVYDLLIENSTSVRAPSESFSMRILEKCKSLSINDAHCKALMPEFVDQIIASNCVAKISEACCYSESLDTGEQMNLGCQPFNGNFAMLNVMIRWPGEYALRVRLKYSKDECSQWKQSRHIIDNPLTRVAVSSAMCPVVTTIMNRVQEIWNPDNETRHHRVLVQTNVLQSHHFPDGYVCLRVDASEHESCQTLHPNKGQKQLIHFFVVTTSRLIKHVKLTAWWAGKHEQSSSCKHITTSTSIELSNVLNTSSSKEGADFVVVTAASEDYFPRLQNLLGSLALWEPKLKVEVVNLGLSEKISQGGAAMV